MACWRPACSTRSTISTGCCSWTTSRRSKRNMLLRKLAKEQKQRPKRPPRRPVRLAFMGSPDFAVPALRALAAAGHEVAAVYASRRDRPHRGQRDTPARCTRRPRRWACRCARRPGSARNAATRRLLRRLGLEVAVVAAYGLILPAADAGTRPRRGCLNIHASLLPRWRGAAPDPCRGAGRRCADRHHHHADGRGAGYRGRCCCARRPQSVRATPRPTCMSGWRRSAAA